VKTRVLRCHRRTGGGLRNWTGPLSSPELLWRQASDYSHKIPALGREWTPWNVTRSGSSHQDVALGQPHPVGSCFATLEEHRRQAQRDNRLIEVAFVRAGIERTKFRGVCLGRPKVDAVI
jgi:hypothetical protein